MYGVDFDLGMFLNIGREYIGPLEHTDFEDYFSCKLQLMEHCKIAVINRDMDDAQRVLERARAHAQRVITFGKSEGDSRDENWTLTNIEKAEPGFAFTTLHNGRSRRAGASAWRARL